MPDSQRQYSSSLHEGSAAIYAAAQRWEELYVAASREPSTGYGWSEALISTHVGKDDRLHLIEIQNGAGQISALVPVVVSPVRRKGVVYQMASPLCRLHSTHGDFLTLDSSESMWRAFFAALDRLPGGWDVFCVNDVVEATDLISSLLRYLRDSRRTHLADPVGFCYELQLPDSYEEYLKTRSSNMRKFLKRTEKRILALADTEVRSFSEFSNLETAYECLLDVEKFSWKQGHGTAISAVGRQQDFYRIVTARAQLKGELHLHFLFHRERPIAYNLGIVHAQRYSYLKTSYVEEYEDHNPSSYLRARLFQELIGQGVRLVDFGAEAYEWHRRWAGNCRQQSAVKVYARTPKGILVHALSRLRSFLKRGEHGEVKYRDPLDTTATSE